MGRVGRVVSFKRLEEFEKQRAAERRAAAAERAEGEARRALKRAVKDVLPADLKKPKRPKGRPPVGGLTRKEVAMLRERAAKFLDGKDGLSAFAKEAHHTALVILLIDGVLGTEPWRAAGSGMHGGIISANARLRYLENAARLLEDLRRAMGGDEPKLLEGVIDAELVEA